MVTGLFASLPLCLFCMSILSPQSPLVQAIFSRNAEDVTFLHKLHQIFQIKKKGSSLHSFSFSGANVNAKDQGSLTPLHRAAASRNERAVELLLKEKAEVNARDKFGHTPLHMAAANWATGCAEALLPHVSSLDVADRSGRTPLHHAAYSGHDEMVNLFLRKGAKTCAKDKKERQPIHLAAYLGHVEVVKLLVSHGADVMCKDKCGYTPLHAAAASGQSDVVQYLLSLGVETDEANIFGNTALHMACHTGQDAVATELVNCGANINQPNYHGNTPLHLAATSSSGVLCLELLVNNGADVNMQVKSLSNAQISTLVGLRMKSFFSFNMFLSPRCLFQNKEGKSALHMAAMYGHKTNIKKHKPDLNCVLSRCDFRLLAGGEVDCVDVNGNTPLHVAARHGQENVECLNLLINFGAELDIKDDLGRSPLHYAAANGNSQCTVSLVRAGAEVNELDLTNCSPLHYAAASHTFCGPHMITLGCLDYLLDNGANPTLKNTKGYSAVHYAAAYGNKQHLELLLEISFNCLEEAESNIPVSPLHLAAYYGHCDALHLLCETLVSLDVRDVEGQTALHLAAHRGFASCVEVLLKHQASYTLKEHRRKWTALHAAAAEGQMECLLLLVNMEQSADIIDSQDTQGQTALMLAALGLHTDCVHILLEKKAQADAGDKQGFTALHRAAMLGSEECVSALLEHGASALCRDSQGRTPLHLAASRGHTELLRTLLMAARTADPLDSMLDYRGYTPTHWAAYHGHEGCLCILLEYKLYSTREGNSFTPLHCALVNGHDVAANLLVKTVGPQAASAVDAKGRTPLHAAAHSGNVAGLQLVLDQGAEVNAVDKRGSSALMVAASCGQTSAVEFLLHKAKPDLTLVDVNNNTALHLACSKGHEMCALLILGEIADSSLINARNNALQMPLHIAARKGLATVVQVLLSRGAAVMAVDEEGHTPALACAPNKNVADCLALILSTMKPFPPREASNGTASHFGSILKNCGIAAASYPPKPETSLFVLR
uniref:Serine/threonine-protein phosphatase 6 regulatory ankyrin repeat subunit C-like n=1 Tax=Salarias fasciatus TaxID=181472 RepID=A0A672JKQ9_SALFA